MDAVSRLKDEGKIEIIDVLGPTVLAFNEAMNNDLSAITGVQRSTFKYGTEERRQLDIYYPPTIQSSKTPVLFWIYGGGFVSGDRVLPLPSLSYPNVGAFFARQGAIMVVPDYRLASPPMSAQYPKPVEDIRDAVQWIIANRDKLISQTTPNPDTDNIFMLGHSAGAVHLATLLLEPEVLAVNSPLRSKMRGVVLLAGYYYYDPRSQLDEHFELYYGDKQESHSALTLLRSAKSKGLNTLPNILFGESEWDPPIVDEIRRKFQHELETFLQRPVKHLIAKRHNHISICAALSSGQGEEWALEVMDWIRSLA
ncbi:hypothetical protein AGABI1DRAFT_108898 [Agaricus bisporus var. burnettii JB137-S8]|uniref:BD-FAE-like domain-containing protein n=1 Tax=Agaricus bisporus var. burnettii (strain JB137-S8 / ATCC MYA-4627 / FGSC 10392) TaxID=597362 RepID=K5WZS8_AGABU|nr:uncharacterized protein AGABI1DRAFT_108898 [Agaricus bisporus var. burnettii JB137-S8]EKM76363.1 hypothetical protein AGABI1DRAFT_108898 [Agaricus bisporus var. burnettii JB137-S8]